MRVMSNRRGTLFTNACLAWAALWLAAPLQADRVPDSKPVSEDEAWRQTLDLVSQGEFEKATETAQQMHSAGELAAKVSTWLSEYQEKQAARRALDLEDFNKYVGYAKARIEREEYRDALDWALAALDCAPDREALLTAGWLTKLVNQTLTDADEFRKESDWRGAWRVYSRLSLLHENEPRYEALEREAAEHLRLENLFKEDTHWEERIERVRWKDAERAINHLDNHYVSTVDFKAVTESGLKHLLLLADSKTAQEAKGLEGLANEVDRDDFKSRLHERLEQVQAAATLTRRDCVEHFRRVVRTINNQTVRLPEAVVVSEMMRGAFNPLDDFTTIIWPAASREFTKHTRGDFVGVGISIRKNGEDEVEVASPLDDSPAYRAGIQAGDIITEADGIELKGFSINKVVETITGPEGTDVSLTIRRGKKEIPYTLERAKVKIVSVKGLQRDPENEERWDHWADREQGIGYVRIGNFQRNTLEDLQNTLDDMSGLRGLILDLRGNPGGLLDSAWQVSAQFLRSGDTIVSTKGMRKRDDQAFPAPTDGDYADIPLVVLVDERSASASEIVSGAIRDNKRGTVVGERTFGKFSVQNLIPLSNSREGAQLKITTARYYLPNGESFHRVPGSLSWGVVPDIPVRLVTKEAINVYRMRREADLLGPPKPTDEESKDNEATGDKDDEVGKPADATAEGTDEKKPKEGAEGEVVADATDKDGDAKAEDPDKPKLPLLEQPDENNRPNEDAQLDAALLLLRVKLIGQSHPTLAKAATETDKETRKP